MSKPVRLRNHIIVQKSNEISLTLGYTAITGTTQASHSFDRIARLVFLCNPAGRIISLGVIDHEYVVGMRVETPNRGETSLEKIGTVTGTDDNSRSNWQLAGLGR